MKSKNKASRAAALSLTAAMSLSSLPLTIAAPAAYAEGERPFGLRGDIVDDDGITGNDAIAALERDAGVLAYDKVQEVTGDANKDKKYNIADAVAILQWLAKTDVLSPVGEYVYIDTPDVPAAITGAAKSFAAPGTSITADFDNFVKGSVKVKVSYTNTTGEDQYVQVYAANGDKLWLLKLPPADGEALAAAVITLPEGMSSVVIESTDSFDSLTSNVTINDVYICPANLFADPSYDRTPSAPVTTEQPPVTTTSQEQPATTTAAATEAPATTTTTTTTTSDTRYYAAHATVTNGVADEKTNEGFECPDGYANVNNEVGSSVEFTVDVPESGNYEITVRYSNGKNDDRSMQVITNGNTDDKYYISFDGTDAWTTWADQSIVLPLNSGTNTIKLVSTTENGGPNIDYIDVIKTDKEAAAPSATERYYASLASIHQGWTETSNTGFEGESYVNYDNRIGGYIEWTVNAPEDGNYLVDFRFANGTADNRQIKLITNGDRTHGQYVDFTGTGAWTTWSDTTAVVTLTKGENKLKAYATTKAGGPNMDYIELSQTGSAAPNAKATKGVRVEKLNRGVAMAYNGSGNLVSWRLLATDNENTTFKLWRIRSDGNTLLGEFTTKDASNYFDKEGLATDSYTIDTYVGDERTEFAQASVNFTTPNNQNSNGKTGAYFDIKTNTPPGGTSPDGVAYTYTENDCSVGDVDGDGQYEIFVKWDPSNSHDNSKDGYSGPVIIDCYRLDGTQLWRINLGNNIRAGAHYTQFMVYDFDGDGKCELICKTADGTQDGQGNYVGDKSKDYRSSAGRILTGPEYITLFDGLTGKALDTQDYDPGRGTVGDWGDTYGNRVDRFTACVAYLDGGDSKNAYACFGRGYYTRMAVAAWGVSGGKLVKKWTWDTGHNVSAKGYGDGNHHCLGADVDQDGRQEVVCGSVIVDDDGTVLNTTSLAHGDAIHIGDFDPANPGLEIFQCLEDETHPNGTAVNFGIILRDAATAKVLFRETAGGDTGRAIADNLIAGNGGAEMSGSHNLVLYSCTGDHANIGNWITKWGQNSLVYWSGNLERSALDRTMVDDAALGRLFTGDGVTWNNDSKSNACLTADILGDWREEMIFRKSDGTGLRVFTTTYTTEYNLYTLMHNAQYRVQVAAQNNGYNQPPHTDFYIDSVEYTRPEEPDVWTID